MIYYFNGQPGSGKTVLGIKLHKFLKTEKRNWRKNVFHIDEDDVRYLTNNKRYSDHGMIENVRNAQMLAKYLHNNGCDVVISIVSPNRLVREELKGSMAEGDFQEIYVHTTEEREHDNYYVEDYHHPEVNFIDVDTTKDSPNISFSKLINHLNKLNKL